MTLWCRDAQRASPSPLPRASPPGLTPPNDAVDLALAMMLTDTGRSEEHITGGGRVASAGGARV